MAFKIKRFTNLVTFPLKAKENLGYFTNISRIYVNKAIKRLIQRGYYPVEKVKIVPTKRANVYQIRIRAKYMGRKNARRMLKENQGGLNA